jgi:hypothetical protein
MRMSHLSAVAAVAALGLASAQIQPARGQPTRQPRTLGAGAQRQAERLRQNRILEDQRLKDAFK